MLLRPGGSDGWTAQLPRSFCFKLSLFCPLWASPTLRCGVFPFLIFTFFFFLRSGRIAFQLRYVLIGLVAVSVAINSITTVSWLLEADMNVPAETRTKWNEFLGQNVTSAEERYAYRYRAGQPPRLSMLEFSK